MANFNGAFCSIHHFQVGYQKGREISGREIWSKILRLQIESKCYHTISPLFKIGKIFL